MKYACISIYGQSLSERGYIRFMRRLTIIAIALILCGMAACRHEVRQKEAVDDKPGGGYIIKDTIGNSPKTELYTIYDPKGRIYAEGGRASESTEFNFVRYLYDDAGEVSGFLTFTIELEVLTNVDSFSNYHNLLHDNNYKRPEYTRYFFERDSLGFIKRVYDPESGETVIEAPSGQKVEYEVIEDENFWTSCLDGGKFLINFRLSPHGRNSAEYNIR